MYNFNPNVPGQQTGYSYVDKVISADAHNGTHHLIPITIAPNTGDLDKGTVLGQTTADKLFRPVIRSTVTATQPAVAPAAQTITVSAGYGTIFQMSIGKTVASMKADGTGIQELGTIQTVVGDVVTVSTALQTALAAGDYLFVQDGSEKALVILGEVVLDATTNKPTVAYVRGKFYETQLVGLDAIAINDFHARQIPIGTNQMGAQETLLII